MRRSLALCSIALAGVSLGCGGDTRPTRARRVTVTRSPVAFWSPAVPAGGAIPRRYSCAPKAWLPLRWGGLPSDTSEVVLYFGGYGKPRTVAQGVRVRTLVAAWGVIGLCPGLHGLNVGPLPARALALSSARVPACPPKAPGQRIDFKLYALTAAHRVKLSALRATSAAQLLADIRRNARTWGEFDADYN